MTAYSVYSLWTLSAWLLLVWPSPWLFLAVLLSSDTLYTVALVDVGILSKSKLACVGPCGRSVLVSVPTSGGKTACGEAAVSVKSIDAENKNKARVRQNRHSSFRELMKNPNLFVTVLRTAHTNNIPGTAVLYMGYFFL